MGVIKSHSNFIIFLHGSYSSPVSVLSATHVYFIDQVFFFVHMPYSSPVHVLSATRHYSIHLHVFYFSVHRPYSSPVRVLPAVQGRG